MSVAELGAAAFDHLAHVNALDLAAQHLEGGAGLGLTVETVAGQDQGFDLGAARGV